MPSSRPGWRAPVTAGGADLARKIAYRLDPGAALRRSQKAETDRRVSIRPAPDTMSHVTGLLPVAQGVAVYAALRQRAKTLRARGDARTISQIMADTFYTRLTGQESGVGGVEIQLVMNERTLLRGDHEPAHAPGYGIIPASMARRIVREADKSWIRRLYPAPDSGQLVAMDSRRRTFRGKLRDLTVLRDQTAALLGATPLSPTSTTSGRQVAAAGRPRPMARDSARRSTTPKKQPGGASTS